MGQVVLRGNPPIEIVLRRSARARRLSLRVSRHDGRVTLSMPDWTAEREALDFARQKEDWIRHHLDQRAPDIIVATGGVLPFEGRDHPVVAAEGRSVRLQDGRILVPGSAEKHGARIKVFLKLAARDRLSVAVDRYAAQLGREVTGLALRDTRSRWGSCTARGRLMFSWRLVMAPPEILDYVAAHEVAHLVEMNHSPAYWAVVGRICPDYAARRRWLRDHGGRLQAVRFAD